MDVVSWRSTTTGFNPISTVKRKGGGTERQVSLPQVLIIVVAHVVLNPRDGYMERVPVEFRRDICCNDVNTPFIYCV